MRFKNTIKSMKQLLRTRTILEAKKKRDKGGSGVPPPNIVAVEL